MFKTIHRTIEYPVNAEYVDLDGNLWSYRAYVQMSASYEVRGVVLTFVEVFDQYDNKIPLFPLLTESMKDNLREYASNKALEKVQAADFESEGDND